MAGTHRYWSIYQDSSCGGAPTGVFVQRRNDCASQVASSGSDCAAQYDTSDNLVGYVDDSCYDGCASGLDELFDGEPYMAYDYYNDASCSDYENSAAYLATGDCETIHQRWHLRKQLRQHRWRVHLLQHVSRPRKFQLGIFVVKNKLQLRIVVVKNKLQLRIVVVNSSDGGGGGGLSTGAIAEIAVGAAVVIVAILVLAWCLRRRGKKQPRTQPLQDPFIVRGSAWTGGATVDSESSTLGVGLWNDDAMIATRVPRDQVTVEGLISRGGFGEVYRGKYNNQDVAIKMLFPEMRSDLKKVNAFLAEVKLMAGLSHPHIVRFVGVSWGSLTDLCVLTELMKCGDLRSLLKGFEEQNHSQGIDHDKIRIAYQIGQALTYLHSLSPIVIHRDLKSKNVLLTEDLDTKLTDFGASRERQEQTMTAGVGTMLWMAPEVMMAEHYDEKADIFSFGVLLSELDLQSLPYAHARYDTATGKKAPDAVILQKAVSGDLHVAFSPHCLASLVQLGNECVALDPSARPSVPMVVFRLQTIMKESFSA